MNTKKKNLSSKVIVFLIIASIIFSALTYITITKSTLDYSTQQAYATVILLAIDSAIIFALIILISKKLFSSWIKHKRNSRGSRLQIRTLVMFSLLSSIPAILVAIFSAVFFKYVIDSWFDKKISTVLDESVVVAESYLQEHHDVIKIRAKAMAMEIDENVLKHDLLSNKKLFTDVVSSFTELNSLSEAVVFSNHYPLIRSRFGISLSYEVFTKQNYMDASSGESIIISSTPDRIRAMVILHSIPNGYLVVGKYVDSKVVDHIKKSQGAAEQYKNFKNQIISTQLQFAVIFLIVSVLILLIAIYIGISFSATIIDPVKKLVYATERVQDGNFSTRVDVDGPDNDELANLSRAFNLMTERISEQQTKLVQAYNELDNKRKFDEAVLSAVSTGIIALSADRKIKLINDSGAKLLKVNNTNIVGTEISEVIPDCSELISEAKDNEGYASKEIKLKVEHKLLTLLLKISAEITNKKTIGYVITFDDMTELLQAQRYAAWSDVARRIAHEVKNPLTPIRLGAERLQKKYASEVSDGSTFSKYTDTIIRHVKDIGKIIEEFSAFARMPAPVMEEVNIIKIVENLVFSRECVVTNIKYELELNKNDDIFVLCDQTQINQMLINILKNAEESIEATPKFEKGQGKIKISVHKDNKYAKLFIIDNGKGFDSSVIDKLIEPYFTTRTKGTGLGLAIVKKIVDDHNGKIIMENNQDHCAVVTVLLPLF